MRAVFDTNVLISALLFEHSTPAQAFFTALNRGEILLCAPLAEEINRKVHQPKFDPYLSFDQREVFIAALVEASELVEITETITICRDPNDNMLLELAVSGRAEVIVTGDKDLLVLHPFREIAVLNPKDFLAAYNP
ncbi:MAG TPA: putative toxin-antitoxin system toxin component, PIN family [Anaerolineales bacterium]|nr:putative toxin-antitoxin system toxin component, PIN family [Anaerolineales bacterium]